LVTNARATFEKESIVIGMSRESIALQGGVGGFTPARPNGRPGSQSRSGKVIWNLATDVNAFLTALPRDVALPAGVARDLKIAWETGKLDAGERTRAE